MTNISGLIDFIINNNKDVIEQLEDDRAVYGYSAYRFKGTKMVRMDPSSLIDPLSGDDKDLIGGIWEDIT